MFYVLFFMWKIPGASKSVPVTLLVNPDSRDSKIEEIKNDPLLDGDILCSTRTFYMTKM